MQQISVYILPGIVCGILLFGVFRKVKVFDCFVEGAKEGAAAVYKLLPTLLGLIVAVTMVKSSGALDVLCWILRPVAKATGIPEEVMPITVISPFSGSGSLALFETILKDVGPDSFTGRVASVMMGSTETTFYATALYFGAVGISKTRQTVPAALFADFTSYVMSVWAVRWLM